MLRAGARERAKVAGRIGAPASGVNPVALSNAPDRRSELRFMKSVGLFEYVSADPSSVAAPRRVDVSRLKLHQR
jgi:hypothetical protein